ncbi:MAG: type II secretion system major pseudopilin GspG [Chthoniobacteraceae bacterium]
MKRPLHLGSAGFTLLEIMLVVMIIAVLAGSAIFFMGDNLGVAQKVRVEADFRTIKTQLTTYQGLNGFLPTTEQGLKALTTKPESSPKPRSWQKLMEQVPLDPYGYEYQYVSPGVHNPDSYDIFSAGRDRKPGTPDDIGNWESQ